MKYILAVFALCASCYAAQLKGQVLDTSEAVIQQAHIIIHWDSVGLEGVKENVGIAEDKILTADDLGRFAIELPPGVYDVFVTSRGFLPTCMKLSLKRNKTRYYEVTLKVSRIPVVNLD